jgi:hypothetical protein
VKFCWLWLTVSRIISSTTTCLQITCSQLDIPINRVPEWSIQQICWKPSWPSFSTLLHTMYLWYYLLVLYLCSFGEGKIYTYLRTYYLFLHSNDLLCSRPVSMQHNIIELCNYLRLTGSYIIMWKVCWRKLYWNPATEFFVCVRTGTVFATSRTDSFHAIFLKINYF